LLTGILRPDDVGVFVDAVDPAQDPLAARRRIGALTDTLRNYPRLTATEHLQCFGRLPGLPETELQGRIDGLTALLDMSGIASRPVPAPHGTLEFVRHSADTTNGRAPWRPI
jgi:ABC-type Na+ transport system ATPase subunit NatA